MHHTDLYVVFHLISKGKSKDKIQCYTIWGIVFSMYGSNFRVPVCRKRIIKRYNLKSIYFKDRIPAFAVQCLLSDQIYDEQTDRIRINLH